EFISADPIITLTTMKINGMLVSPLVQNDTNTWMDDINFVNPLGQMIPFTAGTTVSGTVTLQGAGAFVPGEAATLELLSGFKFSNSDWGRLESLAEGVPEPSALVLLGATLAALAGRMAWRRRLALSE